MLKHRIIQTLLIDETLQVVKPVAFCRPYRKLGTLRQYLNVIERRNIDELILIDITATEQNRKMNYEAIRNHLDNVFCPITLGGGISSLDDIRMALENGADKVAIKTNTELIEQAAKKFGSQAIVSVLDFDAYDKLDEMLITAKNREYEGAGELILTFMPCDGAMQGYFYTPLNFISERINIPIIALGGCGEPKHMHQALTAGASAVAAGSMFLYTDYTPKECAEYLYERQWPVRLDNVQYH